ncbi:MAG: ACT domain-containing protein [Candidatus Muiribacteriota bacterium]
MKKEKIVITALGVNKAGVVANITSILGKYNCSIMDMAQTIIDDLFALIMIVDISDLNMDFSSFKTKLEKKADNIGIKIFVQHENVFRFMHRI